MEHVAGAAGGAGAALLVLLGLVVWVVKYIIPAMVKQNEGLISGALENMKANTSAIEANTKVTSALAKNLELTYKMQERRDQELQRQLDRIERKVE